MAGRSVSTPCGAGIEFVYVGITGSSKTLSDKIAAAGKSGLRGRLASHRSGNTSGDKFCVYVADEILEAAGMQRRTMRFRITSANGSRTALSRSTASEPTT